MLKRILVVCGLFAMAALPSFANTWAYTDLGPGTQFGYPGILLGQAFTVNNGYSVTLNTIGAFTTPLGGGGYAVIGSQIEVGIVTAGGSIVAGTDTIFAPGTYTNLHGQDAYKLISPVTLTSGSYWLVALGFMNNGSSGNMNGNTLFNGDPAPVTDNFGGALSFGISGYTLNPGGVLSAPGTIDYGQTQPQYEIGTFAYTPEPGLYGVLALGLVGLAAGIRRRKSV